MVKLSVSHNLLKYKVTKTTSDNQSFLDLHILIQTYFDIFCLQKIVFHVGIVEE